MNKKSNEDMVILDAYWFYRDDLLTLETFLEVLKNLKENHKRKMKEFEEEENKADLQEKK